MKKKILTTLLLAALTASLFTGCGSSSSSSSGSSKPASTTSTTSSSAKAETEVKKEEPKAEPEAKVEEPEESGQSVAEWVEDYKSMVSAMGNSEMEIFLVAVDDKTVSFQFQFTEQVPLDDVDQADIDAEFDAQFEAQKSVFVEMRDSLVDETGVKDVVLRIEYLNADGSLIYSKDFTD